MTVADRFTFGDREHVALRMLPSGARTPIPFAWATASPLDVEEIDDSGNDQPFVDREDDGRALLLRELHPIGYRDLRALSKGKPAGTSIVPASDFSTVHRFVADHIDRDLYMGVAARASTDRRQLLALYALHVDLDFKMFPSGEAEARARLATFSFQPSAIVTSGGGLHVYWLLIVPLDLQTPDNVAYAKQLLCMLCHALGGDPSSAEPAHILRVPGTSNFKYDPPRPVVVEAFNPERRYQIDEILAVLPPIESDRLVVEASTATPVAHGLSREKRMSLARAWVAKQPPAHDDDPTYYQTACAVAVGHDLDANDTFDVLKEWNARCSPPASDEYVRLKIRNAIKYATGSRGAKLVQFPLTEAGDATFFAEHYAERVRFDHRAKRWLILDDKSGIWVPDSVGNITCLALDAIRLRQQHAAAIEDERRAKAVAWTFSGESHKRLMNLLALARNFPPLADDGENWDQIPHLLGTPGGAVDLRTGHTRRATADERITMRTSVDYDPEATSTLWETTLVDIFPAADERT